MKRLLILVGLAGLLTRTPSLADEPAPVPDELTAHEAVREGNRRLIAGNPSDALEAYRYAEELQPDAREIAFVQGLATYDLKEFDQAREAFEKAAALANDQLAADALYSLGTCDHAEALESLDNPKLALSLLENAMRRYHDVLAERPDHEAAREANLKAASMWRQLKQQLQQQPQQQQQNSDQNDDQENQDQQRQESQQPQEENDPQDEQQPSESSDRQEDQQPQQQQAAAEKQEQVSREQAQRKLREMMQALRERKKARRELVYKVPVAPVDKDW